MGAAALIGTVFATLGAGQAFIGAEAQRRQANYQAQVAQSNAQALRAQANNERLAGEIEARNLDKQKEELRRVYDQARGENIATMAAVNIALGSGSSEDLLAGNAALFSEDIATNRYNREVALWNAEVRAGQNEYQAAVYDSQSSYLKKTAGSLGTSLLSAGIGGLTGFASGYTMGGGNLSNLFGLSSGGGDIVVGKAYTGTRTLPNTWSTIPRVW